MMTGPEHYRAAQGIAHAFEQGADGFESDDQKLALAQIHATLALAAATLLVRQGYQVQIVDDQMADWFEAMGTPYQKLPNGPTP